ncbi:restriction endonuclease subunit S [Ligilactobacillus salivarius]|uniref:Restriction endonuclease subunit S n=1 Tax=Ligilactobacillus salivarius TaxID=1624 RepID=A0AAX3XAH1_9LACO|nr:restriction endonuclease subunit S [Ligilactobacillus salivarius]WII29459.1 restriction endonuclease subunit S [Ligilactobacillus salivarius]
MFPTQFTGASFTWERKELNNILKINSGRDYKQLNSGNIPVYGTGGYMLSVNDKLSDTDAVGIGRKGTIDKPLYLKAPFWTVDTLFYCTSKENSDVKFIYLLFQIINWKRYDESTGVPSLSKNTISNIKTYVPKIEEQDYISKLFFSLDNTLQLHEDHLQFLHSFKSFLLQKMFFDNDIPPLLRFNKFTEKWNQCRLNDHTIVTMGQSPNSKNYTNNQTGKILVQGNADLYKNKVLKRVFTTEVTKTAVKNDILISVRAPVGDIARNQYESVVIGRGIASIKGNDFLYYQLEKMKNNGFWNKYIAGSTFESITGKDLKNTKIYTTNSDEERKIGNIFSSLTKIIQLQEHKIDSLKKLKQFLLQNMFI